MDTKEKWYVYRVINHDKKEVFHGLSFLNCHYKAFFKAISNDETIKNWEDEDYYTEPKFVSFYKTKKEALEDINKIRVGYRYKSYKII